MKYVYAIGDVHGCLDLVEQAVAAIGRHAAGHAGTVVLLGDYVDRGPDSRGVVEFLMRLPAGFTCLKGNHEFMLVSAYRNREPAMVDRWLRDGGDETLRSYGWPGGEPDLSFIPEAHVEWMDALPLLVLDDHRVYVHAGLVPGIKPHRQPEAACLWIRERFLLAGAEDLPAHVVHGHTPQWYGKPDLARPERLPHRTNLDTGAHATGVLSVGVFDADQPGPPVEVLAIRRPGAEAGEGQAAPLARPRAAAAPPEAPALPPAAERLRPLSHARRTAPRRGPNLPVRPVRTPQQRPWRR
jgi:serine/threonine protein phosphatase 1